MGQFGIYVTKQYVFALKLWTTTLEHSSTSICYTSWYNYNIFIRTFFKRQVQDFEFLELNKKLHHIQFKRLDNAWQSDDVWFWSKLKHWHKGKSALALNARGTTREMEITTSKYTPSIGEGWNDPDLLTVGSLQQPL